MTLLLLSVPTYHCEVELMTVNKPASTNEAQVPSPLRNLVLSPAPGAGAKPLEPFVVEVEPIIVGISYLSTSAK